MTGTRPEPSELQLALLWRRYLRLHWQRSFDQAGRAEERVCSPPVDLGDSVRVVRGKTLAWLREVAEDKDLFDLAVREETAGVP